MIYGKIKEGIFLRRPNRFISYVIVDGVEEKVHVKNTGRCKELLIEGARVILEEGISPKRKTKYSIIAVYKGNILINMDSQIPNVLVEEALKEAKIKEIGHVDYVKREVKYLNSRFDIYYEKGPEKGFIEVKGVTLEKNGDVYFPDAPTERGKKHVLELVKAVEEGYKSWIFFVVQLKCGGVFRPNYKTDQSFAENLIYAYKKGVNIIAYDCNVYENKLFINKNIEVVLEE